MCDSCVTHVKLKKKLRIQSVSHAKYVVWYVSIIWELLRVFHIIFGSVRNLKLTLTRTQYALLRVKSRKLRFFSKIVLSPQTPKNSFGCI